MLKIVRPVSFVLLSAAFCSGGVVHASDRAAITPRVGISQQEGSLKGTVSDSFGPGWSVNSCKRYYEWYCNRHEW